jgi:hypothetical protein
MKPVLAIMAGAVLAISSPAFSAQPVANSYDVCLLRTAQGGGYFTSLDNGDSAIALMHSCDPYRSAWINQCVTGNGNYSDCAMKSGMRALLTVVVIEDARAFTHPANGDRQ